MRAQLEDGLRRQFRAGRPLVAYLEQTGAELSRRDRFLAVARAGLRRLEEERDVNRLLLRDLASFPDLLDQVRTQELARVHEALTGWLARESPRHPHGVDSERFLRTLADLAVAVGDGVADPP